MVHTIPTFGRFKILQNIDIDSTILVLYTPPSNLTLFEALPESELKSSIVEDVSESFGNVFDSVSDFGISVDLASNRFTSV